MEMIMMPMWANICVIAAMLGVFGLTVAPKINKETVNLKTAYYIAAVSVVVILGTIFCFASHVSVTNGLLICYAVIAVVSVIACAIACMDGGPNAVFGVGAVAVVVIMFATLAFANVAYAAIWAAVLALMLFIGHLLFPSKKK